MSQRILFPFAAMLAWPLAELAVRTFGVRVLGAPLDNPLAGDMLAVAVTFPLLAWLIARLGGGAGISREDWNFRLAPGPVLAGLACGLAALLIIILAAQVDRLLFGSTQNAVEAVKDRLSGGAWVAVLFLLVNGFVVPVCEELAWRGVIQTALARHRGVFLGFGLTMLAFTLKHVVVDQTLVRVTSIAALSAVLGLARLRWGTGSSTATHIFANSVASAALILSA